MCIIVTENIFVRLLAENRFKDFTKKNSCNAHKNTEILLAIDADSREKVEEMVKTAMELGGTTYMEP